jgi:alanyl-tRNA synthetase
MGEGMKHGEIRQRFEDYYKSLGFYQLPRAPLLHPSIPMSFVMSAGLVQIETSLAQAKERTGNQFVLVQECFRHFDLDKVGTDNVHLSFFQMPGAFVFGPNGKAETVRRMWRLATSVLGIDKNRIWVSYFRGGRILNEDLPCDEETYKAWVATGVPESRIVALRGDNYWVQGDGIDGMATVRKCGPNTELFYDMGFEKACGLNCRPGCKCGRFVEFSNSLFVCRELDSQGQSSRPMAEPFAETVIGTERVAMILQGVSSVFGTDSYRPIIDALDSFVEAPSLDESLVTASKQVIADHLKALCFLVSDGAPPPGKDGRERIIKLLIRGVITRQIVLGIESREFLPTVLACIAEAFGDTLQATPENKHRLMSYFSIESKRYANTIERGRRQLERFVKANEGRTLSGPQIVCLEKRWGLLSLLTAAMLRERKLTFAEAEYREALERWKHASHN